MKPPNIVISLLRHFVPHSLRLTTLLHNLFISRSNSPARFEFKELLFILVSRLNDFKIVWIVIDGLDEYPEGTDGFLYRFDPLVHHGHANIFVSSRPTSTNKGLFRNGIQTEMPVLNDDISVHILDRILRTSNPALRDTEVQVEVKEEVKRLSGRRYVISLKLNQQF